MVERPNTILPNGPLIRQLREELGLSQDRLVEDLKKRGFSISNRTLERVEAGKPTRAATLAAIADTLDTTVRKVTLQLKPVHVVPPQPTLFVGRDKAMRYLKSKLIAPAIKETKGTLRLLTGLLQSPIS